MQLQLSAYSVSAISTSFCNILVDAPDVWLAQLLSGQYLDSDDELSLFETCKKLNEMVMQNSGTTALTIEPLARPVNRMVSMLQTANRHARSINLCLENTNDCSSSWRDKQNSAEQMMQVVSNILVAAVKQQTMTAITEIRLEGAKLGTILPPVVGQACPNLTTLSLHDCIIGLDRAVSYKQHFQKLRVLEIKGCDCEEALVRDQQEGCSHDESRPGLPALSSLTMSSTWSSFDGEVNIINSLAAPLTQLCFNLTWMDRKLSLDYHLKDMDWVQLGATLRHLQLPHLYVDDDAMEVLLNMPCLTHLLVHFFELEESYVDRPCTWEELEVLQCGGLKTLANLPFHPGLRLAVGQGAGVGCQLCMTTGTYHLLPHAVRNMKRLKTLEWAGGRVKLSAHSIQAPELAECMSQALPIIEGVKNLEIWGGDLNGAAMQALCEFVRDREDGPSVAFISGTQWLLPDMVTFVARMPSNSTICVTVKSCYGEQQIIRLCCAAKNKLSLHAYWQSDEHFCAKHIRAALQARNLETLSLDINHDNTLDITIQPRQSNML